jgi:hypothetical protein
MTSDEYEMLVDRADHLRAEAKEQEPEEAPVQVTQVNVLTHNGVFTVKSLRTGEHRTFQIRTQPKDSSFAPGKRVVALLSGPDNTSDYTGFGFVESDTIYVWRSKRNGLYERYARMLLRLAEYIRDGDVEVYAATRCRVCNRQLTTPESVESGIGPVCEGR